MKVYVATVTWGSPVQAVHGQRQTRIFSTRKKACKWAAKRYLKLRHAGWLAHSSVGSRKVH